MSAIVRRIRIWRPLVLLMVAVAIGIMLVAPVAAQVRSGSPKVSATIYTRSASCSAFDFHPIQSATGYTWVGPGIFHSGNGDGGIDNGFFACDPGLPDKAVVTRVRFTLYDDDTTFEANGCALVRGDLGLGTAGSYHVMATVPSTGQAANPGVIRYGTTSISAATVDHSNYGYWLQCELGSGIGIYGADVRYTISAANG